MIHIIVTALAFLALTVSAAALHTQVPYTQLPPLPGWSQPQSYLSPSPMAPRPPSIYDPAPSGFSYEPERKPRRSSRGGILGDIQGSIGQTYQQETAHDRMMREFREEQDRIAEGKIQEFQNDNIERAIRCSRFGSREAYADCHNWQRKERPMRMLMLAVLAIAVLVPVCSVAQVQSQPRPEATANPTGNRRSPLWISSRPWTTQASRNT